MRKYLGDSGEPRGRARPRRAQPVLEEVRGRIDEILQEWSTRTTGKQRITVTLVHAQLLREGYQVGSTTVRAYLAEQRRQRQEVYVPLIWRPGEAAQVDFFEVTDDLDPAADPGCILSVIGNPATPSDSTPEPHHKKSRKNPNFLRFRG